MFRLSHFQHMIKFIYSFCYTMLSWPRLFHWITTQTICTFFRYAILCTHFIRLSIYINCCFDCKIFFRHIMRSIDHRQWYSRFRARSELKLWIFKYILYSMTARHFIYARCTYFDGYAFAFTSRADDDRYGSLIQRQVKVKNTVHSTAYGKRYALLMMTINSINRNG